MGWIRIVGKTLEFSGQIVQSASFEDWAISKGEKIVERIARDQATAAFEREDSEQISESKTQAMTEIWRDLQIIAQRPALAAFLNELAMSYIPHMNKIAKAFESNQFSADGEAFVLPKLLINSIFFEHLVSNLEESDEFCRVKGGVELRNFFYDEFISQLDSAFESLTASPSNPVRIGDHWCSIGSDLDYIWMDGNKWKGYIFLFGSAEKLEYNKKVNISSSSAANKRLSLEVTMGRLRRSEKKILVDSWNDTIAAFKNNSFTHAKTLTTSLL